MYETETFTITLSVDAKIRKGSLDDNYEIIRNFLRDLLDENGLATLTVVDLSDDDKTIECEITEYEI